MVKSINVNDIDNIINDIKLIDIREPFETVPKALLNSVNIPMETLLSKPKEYLDMDKEYYIICHSGARSLRTCSELDKEGFNVINVVGGTAGYIGTKLK